MSYQAEYERSMNDPQQFWSDQAKALDWFEFPRTILKTDADGLAHWFSDGEMNTAYMALDCHVKNGRSNQIALIYDSPVTGKKISYTYAELTDLVARTAGMLSNLGVCKGDRVIIYMPMIPEAVISMLAVARLGAIHSVVFGGFAPAELAVRIDDALPKVILSASCGIEVKRIIEYKPLLDQAIQIASHRPDCCVIFQRPECIAKLTEGYDHDWASLLAQAKAVDCTPVKGSDPLYILYTSGSTGKPKGVVRENGGHAVALKYSMKTIYNADPGDVFWAASDVGWVVGHSYIVYGPLLHGCTTIVYEGKPVMTPDAGALWRVCAEHGVKALFTAPTAFRAVKKEDPEALLMKPHGLDKLQAIFSAGERLDPPTQEWLTCQSGKPVIDHWWQTETGWGITANFWGLEPMAIKYGSSTLPSPGFDVQIIGDDGHQLPAGKHGYIAIKLPLPPACLNRIWGDDAGFHKNYLDFVPGYYISGDGGYIDEDGYVYVMGRVDDVINVAGHRLSTGEIEEVIASHPDVAECAVIACDDELRGQVPLGLLVLKSSATINHELLKKELLASVRSSIGAITCYKDTVVLKRLPKTRSGKTLRKTLNKIINGQEYQVPSTIDDPNIIPEIIVTLRQNQIIN